MNKRTNPEDAVREFVHQTDAQDVDTKLLERFENLTGFRPHRYLRRGIVFCHRDLEAILDRFERGLPFYLKTGRGPSSDSLHIGHTIPFEFTKWLQEVFKVPLVIMLTDDMKLLHDKKLAYEDVRRYDIDNAKDILAFGFDPAKTFIFSNLDFVGGDFYKNIIDVARHIKMKDIKSALGFGEDDNVGMFYCCSTQFAGTFATSFPGILGTDRAQLRDMSCLIACSYDIDGYFSEGRKHTEKLGCQRPSFMYSRLLPALQGVNAKMSASIRDSAIFLTDDPSTVRAKLEKAFPISAGTDANHENTLEYLRFFMEGDQDLSRLEQRLQSDELSREEVRDVLIDVVQTQVTKFQSNRNIVTDDLLKRFMTPRLLEGSTT